MKVILKIVVSLALIAGLAFLISGRLRTEVIVAEAMRGSAIDAVTGTIEVVAAVDFTLKTELPGRVREFFAGVGDKVQSGDLIAELASDDAELAIRQKEIQLEAAQARQELPFSQDPDIVGLREAITSLEASVARGLASGQELERVKRDLEKLEHAREAERISRQEALQLLELDLDYRRAQRERMRLRTPYDGIIVEQHAFVGDWLWANNSLVRIVSEDRSVVMTLSEDDYHGVASGQQATIRLASFPGQTFVGGVDSLGLTADPDSKTREVFLKADESTRILVPGLTGEAVLTKAQRDNTIIIPRRALIGRQVFVVIDNHIEIRTVDVGFLSLNKAEILSGLQPGDLVVLENQGFLHDGQRVTPRSL